MAPCTPRPRSAAENSERNAQSSLRPLSEYPLHDAEGRKLSIGNQVEQVSIDEDHGASRSRLHHHGEIIGRDRQRVYVVFDQGWQYMVALPPQHLRLLNTPDHR